MRRRTFILLTSAAAVLAIAAIGHPVRWTEAALLMVDIAAGGSPTPWQQVTGAPVTVAEEWPVDDRRVSVDVYMPAREPRAALVLTPGAAVLGRNEPRLQALARSTARAGFIVAVPELPAVRRLALSRADADILADALRAVHRRWSTLPLGIAGISYGVGPAVIAALEPDLNGKVDFILSVGGYHNTDEVIRFITTGTYRRIGDGRLHRRAPWQYGRWAFMMANAHRLRDPHDADLLQQAARRKLEDPLAATSDLRARMGPAARSVLDLIENSDADKVVPLLAALPESIRQEIDALNLALYDVGSLKARLVLIHGRDDAMIPFTESEALAAAGPRGRTSLYIADSIGHVEFNAVSVANAWTMWRAIDRVLAERR